MWQKAIKKTIFTLNVDGYSPEITRLTYPFMQHYAQKIGADFQIISERKYAQYAPVYEKLQIYDLGREMGNDWNIYIDSDTLVHPDLFDITDFLAKDTVMNVNVDMSGNRWVYDQYFRRDGRHIGTCGWFTIASDWCLDLWHPLDIPYHEALQRIYPAATEKMLDRDHFIDDYTLSRNVARFGLKYMTLRKLLSSIGQEGHAYLLHEYLIPTPIKVKLIKDTIRDWDILHVLPEEIQEELALEGEPAAAATD